MQAAVAIPNVVQDHMRGLDQPSKRQATIVRLGQQTLSSRNLDATLDAILQEVSVVLGTEFCCVLELHDDGTNFAMRAKVGWAPDASTPVSRWSSKDSQAHCTVLTAAPVVSDDLRKETRFNARSLLQEGLVSGLSVPLQGEHRIWGVLAAHSKTPRRFSEQDVHFLQAVANLMSLAIERAAVEGALRNRNRQQAAVAGLGRRALVGPHMDDLFTDAARELAATLEVEVCEVLERSPDGRALGLRAGVGWDVGQVGAARVTAVAGSQGGYTLNAEGPVMVADLRDETRFEPSPILRDAGIVSGISVLIPTRNGAFGILGAYSRTPRTFTLDDSNFLQSVANLLGGAIERHRVEGELRRHRDNLEGLVDERTAALAASNRELEAFSYTISHDLRAPLRSINGLSKIVQRKHGAEVSAPARAMLTQIAEETVRMGRLIESILALSRLGSVEVARGRVDISALTTSVLESLQAIEPGRNVSLSIEPGVEVNGDEPLLRIVMANLVGNAWKFTSRTNDARIALAPEPGGFRIEDNGAGFDMAHARELFQPFHRLHDASQFEGTGIGLATVSRIVARHAGRVWAHSSPGRGATFHVVLPPSPPPVAVVPFGMHGQGHKRIRSSDLVL